MASLLLVGGVEVETHDLEGESLLVELVGLVEFGLVDHLAERALLPLLVVALLPVLLGLLQRLLQVLLVVGAVQLAREVARVRVTQVAVHYLDAAGTDRHLQALAQLGEVDHCAGEGGEDGLGDVLVERAGGGDGDGVAEDHIEALLVDGVLALGLDDLLLAGVPQQHVLQLLVRREAGADGVVVHAFLALVRQLLRDVEVRVLGWLHQVGVHLEGEGPEVAVVHSPALHDLLPDVLAEGLDDQVELRLGIQRLHRFTGARLRRLVLPRVVLRMGDDPN
jgi:hypothetical protein